MRVTTGTGIVTIATAFADGPWWVEVKSGRSGRVSGLAAFRKRCPRSKACPLGDGGVPLQDFLGRPA